MKFSSLSAVVLAASFSLSSPAFAVDVVKWPKSSKPDSASSVYKRKVMLTALEKTKAKYGRYEFNSIKTDKMTSTRAQAVVNEGRQINTYIALTSPEWERETIPVRIPIRRGVLNYRLMLIHQNDLRKFSYVESLADIQQFKAGSKRGWSTTKVLQDAGFNVIVGKKYGGMFLMLDGGRFDFLPLGIGQTFREHKKYKNELELAIEPTIALRMPSPTYFFVSPTEPRLAKRIEEGLEMMVADGSLQEIFNDMYGDDVKKALLHTRKIIDVPNPNLPKETPLHRKELWFQFSEVLEKTASLEH